jgi:hypothetical protein
MHTIQAIQVFSSVVNRKSVRFLVSFCVNPNSEMCDVFIYMNGNSIMKSSASHHHYHHHPALFATCIIAGLGDETLCTYTKLYDVDNIHIMLT